MTSFQREQTNCIKLLFHFNLVSPVVVRAERIKPTTVLSPDSEIKKKAIQKRDMIKKEIEKDINAPTKLTAADILVYEKRKQESYVFHFDLIYLFIAGEKRSKWPRMRQI